MYFSQHIFPLLLEFLAKYAFVGWYNVSLEAGTLVFFAWPSLLSTSSISLSELTQKKSHKDWETLSETDPEEKGSMGDEKKGKKVETGKKVPIAGKRNILITSALPYVNNVPHLGNIIGSMYYVPLLSFLFIYFLFYICLLRFYSFFSCNN